jgi:4'-phosphopantetheinyl transferase EntD
VSWFVEQGCPLDPADLPALPQAGWAAVAGPVIDARQALLPEEMADVSGWADRRQREFSSGRLYARRAMARLGGALQPVRRSDDRAPVWPRGMTGSVTHCDDIAAVIVVRAGVLRTVGVDIECRGRIYPDLYRGLFTAEEQRLVRGGLSSTLLFAAKEAIYKALHPAAGIFIDFPEMEIGMSRGRLVPRYLGPAEPVRALMRDLRIEARLHPGHAVAVAWLSL